MLRLPGALPVHMDGSSLRAASLAMDVWSGAGASLDGSLGQGLGESSVQTAMTDLLGGLGGGRSLDATALLGSYSSSVHGAPSSASMVSFKDLEVVKVDEWASGPAQRRARHEKRAGRYGDGAPKRHKPVKYTEAVVLERSGRAASAFTKVPFLVSMLPSLPSVTAHVSASLYSTAHDFLSNHYSHHTSCL